MERLTRRVSPTFYQCSKPADKFEGNELIRANQKLGKLEDIEQELGIALDMLFKALKKGIIINNNGILRNLSGIVLRYNSYFECYFFEYGCGTAKVKLKDYGKTWALTREELENAKD